MVYIYSSASGDIKQFRLKKLGKWAGCTSISPCSGITALPFRSVLVTLYSGEQHVFRIPPSNDANSVAEVDPDDPDASSSGPSPTYDLEASLLFTKVMKKAFEEIDPGRSDAQASPRVRGFGAMGCEIIGGNVIFGMLHE